MYLLGVLLPDHKLVRIALTNFYGISYDTARRLCARIQLHQTATIGSLTESQITQLSAYLSSPDTIPARKPFITSSNIPSILSTTLDSQQKHQQQPSELIEKDSTLPPSQRSNASLDPLRSIRIEGDLKRQLHANIAHHRNVGSYRGRRHAFSLPVRGQRTSTNANTAKKLNRLERRAFSTTSSKSFSSSGITLSLSELIQPLARLRFSESASS